MVRIDMSEYMEKHSVSRLIGAPPGYVGYEQGGQLTEAVRRRPYAVVLFDEVEKAHPDVWNTLLQVLDDGRLTDGQGRTVDFSNVVIIMTSNIGAQALLQGFLGKEMQEEGIVPEPLKEVVLAAVRKQFRPEFLNRLDDMVVFSPLTQNHLSRIVQQHIKTLGNRMAERDVDVELSPEAVDLVLKNAFDPANGARPIARFVEKVMGTGISRLIITEDLPDHSTILISSSSCGNVALVDEDGFYYHVLPKETPMETDEDLPAKRRKIADGLAMS